jgi:hypothetical protein
MMRFLVVLFVACTPSAVKIDANHPANPKAEPGRLAGPPAALRPGVVETEKPSPTIAPHVEPAPAHHH